MRTEHRIRFSDACDMNAVASESVHLVVTSPPYPMIEMWDGLFRRSRRIEKALSSQDGNLAFELMHEMLDPVWGEVYRVLVPGGIACINIGDATRSLKDTFALYPNHTRITAKMRELGFLNLPNILWRKQTNAPNKFMGSGMMPPGAYATLEHEYILLFRKGGKRLFKSAADKANRRHSAYFWEERNQWFSDVWMDLKGTRQGTRSKPLRQRSGAYPLELAYRLVSMFSVLGDIVLDPFLGTGTTFFAAAAAGRNSIAYEVDPAFQPSIRQQCPMAVDWGRRRIEMRLNGHRQFIRDREAAGKAAKHTNCIYGFPVVTRQESELMLPLPGVIEETAPGEYQAVYEVPSIPFQASSSADPNRNNRVRNGQLLLFDS